MKDGPWEERAQDVVADQQRRPDERMYALSAKEGDDDNLGSAADDRRADKHEHQRYTEVGAVLGQVVRECGRRSLSRPQARSADSTSGRTRSRDPPGIARQERRACSAVARCWNRSPGRRAPRPRDPRRCRSREGPVEVCSDFVGVQQRDEDGGDEGHDRRCGQHLARDEVLRDHDAPRSMPKCGRNSADGPVSRPGR